MTPTPEAVGRGQDAWGVRGREPSYMEGRPAARMPRSESKTGESDAGQPTGIDADGVGRKPAVPSLAIADKTTLKRRPSVAVGMPEATTARTAGLHVGPAEATTEVSTGWA